MRNLVIVSLAVLSSSLVPQPASTASPQCPQPSDIGGQRVFVFDDGSIAMRTNLNVNPDGTQASYMPGDHGFTYMANGIDLWVDGARVDCRDPVNKCRSKFLATEARDFGPGTVEFCTFAMEVEPPANGAVTACRGGGVIGNGKGRPRIGGKIPSIGGANLDYYASMTSLTHKVAGAKRYLDSALIPSVVVPKQNDLGRVVWVRSGNRDAFAIAGDRGPRYGEGSIALHQLLRDGQLTAQAAGPIPLEMRCGPAELGLKPPFQSKPDLADDRCKAGRAPRGGADLRAYAAIETADFIYLGTAQFPRNGNAIEEEVNVSSIKDRAHAAGYTAERLREMIACLDR